MLKSNWRIDVDRGGVFHLLQATGGRWETRSVTPRYQSLRLAVSSRGAGALPEDKAAFMNAHAMELEMQKEVAKGYQAAADAHDPARPWDF